MRAAKENVLDKLFNNRTQYSVPVYQRNYGWTRENCETLYNDIVALIGTDKRHFVGTVAVVARPENNGIHQYLVIDGQQRFTTLFLLIRAIFDTSTEEDVYTKAQCNELLFNIDHYKDWTDSDLNRIKLKPIKSDNDQLLLLMEHRFSEMLPNSQLKRNYDLLCDLLKKTYKTGLMPRDVLNAIKKLECVEIILDEHDGDDPQTVFERINSTGLDLSLADLVRNYMLMTDENADHLYKNYWLKIENVLGNEDKALSDYFLNYFNYSLTEPINSKTAYSIFKKRAESSHETHEAILDKMYRYSRYYAAFVGMANPYSNETNALLEGFRVLRQSTIYIFLFDIFEDHRRGIIDDIVLNQVLEFYLSYTVRRSICGVPSNTYRGLYKGLYSRIFNSEGLKSNDNYMDAILSFMNSLVTQDALPTDEMFLETLMKADIYSRDRKLCKYLLLTIENHDKKEQVDGGPNITIEHIMPQAVKKNWEHEVGEKEYPSVHDMYLNTLGNLTLTGYNSELGTLDFSDKKKKYAEQSKMVVLNKEILSQERWNRRSIEKRAKSLGKILVDIFRLQRPKHQIDYSKYSERIMGYEEQDQTTGTKPIYCVVFGEKKPVFTYQDILQATLKKLYEKSPDEIRRLAQSDYCPSGWKNPFLTLRSTTLRKGDIIPGTHIYYESNLNSGAIMGALYGLLEELAYSTDDLSFAIDTMKKHARRTRAIL